MIILLTTLHLFHSNSLNSIETLCEKLETHTSLRDVKLLNLQVLTRRMRCNTSLQFVFICTIFIFHPYLKLQRLSQFTQSFVHKTLKKKGCAFRNTGNIKNLCISNCKISLASCRYVVVPLPGGPSPLGSGTERLKDSKAINQAHI